MIEHNNAHPPLAISLSGDLHYTTTTAATVLVGSAFKLPCGTGTDVHLTGLRQRGPFHSTCAVCSSGLLCLFTINYGLTVMLPRNISFFSRKPHIIVLKIWKNRSENTPNNRQGKLIELYLCREPHNGLNQLECRSGQKSCKTPGSGQSPQSSLLCHR